MAIQDLKGQIARLPQQPGVYIFLNADGDTLYVGKAQVLRARVRSYLAAEGTSPRIDALLRDAASVDVIVTDSVVEALALENRLIKQRNPRYNILLRDDKTYPYLQLTTTERAPRLLVARRVERDGNVYAGPFMPAAVARRTMSLAHRLFGIRSCNEVIDGKRDRPCLEYDIKRCLAPCVETICSESEYTRAVDQARLLVEGRQEELVEQLRTDMIDAAAAERFEHAAQLRDAMRTVETLRDRHNKVEAPGLGDRDAFGVKAGPNGAVVQVFQMRRGRVCDRVELVADSRADLPAATADTEISANPPAFPASGRGPSAGDIEALADHETRNLLTTAVQQFYAERPAPAELHLPIDIDPEEREAIEVWLSASAGHRVRIVVPRRGEKRGLLDMAMRNAAMAYRTHFGDQAGAAFDALETLRLVLNLPALPRRIECFDISTFQGRETVASMVVAVEGRMRRSEYRKFRIRPEAQAPSDVSPASGSVGAASAGPAASEPDPNPHILDDFAAMHQVVFRRYRKLLETGGPFPDLILIDGGKGQLSSAYLALRELGLERLIAIGIAKQEEIIFMRDRAEGIVLPRDSEALLLIQRIRDEAHRFAVTFHRKARSLRDFRSALDDVLGIGARRRRQLLTAFGSVAGVKRASRAELSAIVGAKAADAVRRHFEHS